MRQKIKSRILNHISSINHRCCLMDAIRLILCLTQWLFWRNLIWLKYQMLLSSTIITVKSFLVDVVVDKKFLKIQLLDMGCCIDDIGEICLIIDGLKVFIFMFFDWYWGLFQKKIWNPPVEDINGNFQGDRVKAVGIPGECQNLRKNEDFQRGWCKKVENSRGVMTKLTGNLGGQLQKKNDILNRGYNFFLEESIWAAKFYIKYLKNFGIWIFLKNRNYINKITKGMKSYFIFFKQKNASSPSSFVAIQDLLLSEYYP